MKRVNIEVWSDFACPWCWIAKRRLEKAIKAVSREVIVERIPRAYRLARGMRAEDFRSAVTRKFGSASTAINMMQAVHAHGANEGLAYHFETMLFGDTTDAHVLVKSVSVELMRNTLIERLFEAVTTDGLNIYDRDVLIRLAEEVDVPANHALFDDPGLIAEVDADEFQLQSVGNGVPMFVFNRQSFLSGAQPVELFVKALRETPAIMPGRPVDTQRPGCDADGCRI